MFHYEGHLADIPVFGEERLSPAYARIEVHVVHREGFLEDIPESLLRIEEIEICAPGESGVCEADGEGYLEFHIRIGPGRFLADSGADREVIVFVQPEERPVVEFLLDRIGHNVKVVGPEDLRVASQGDEHGGKRQKYMNYVSDI